MMKIRIISKYQPLVEVSLYIELWNLFNSLLTVYEQVIQAFVKNIFYKILVKNEPMAMRRNIF